MYKIEINITPSNDGESEINFEITETAKVINVILDLRSLLDTISADYQKVLHKEIDPKMFELAPRIYKPQIEKFGQELTIKDLQEKITAINLKDKNIN